MPDKKNEELDENEMETATGGGATLQGQKAGNREGLGGSARDVIEDPLGPPTSTSGEPGELEGQVKP